MSRTHRYKAGYIICFAIVMILALWSWRVWGNRVLLPVLVIALLAIIARRVQGVFYRDLFRGLALLSKQHPAEALDHFERFLDDVRRRRWQRHLLWLSGTVYTWNVEAMVSNNIGAACLRLGRLEESETALQQAIALDPEYPLPHFNLAILQEMRGDRVLAAQEQQQARKLGYTGGKLDVIIHRAQTLLAHTEARGKQ